MKLQKPYFWSARNAKALLLLPFGLLYLLCYYFIYWFTQFTKKDISPYSNKRTICVGNITLGGTGKTPVCIEIAETLKHSGKNPCFISKGYRRQFRENITIPFNYGQIFDPRVTGEEPILLSTIADTFVLKTRHIIPFKLENYSDIIFDDGLQDARIKYDLQIAIFDCNFFIGNGFVLPAGPMRELLFFKLKQVDKVILTDYSPEFEDRVDFLSRYIPVDKIHTATLKVIGSYDMESEYIAFAGIGNNDKFFKSLLKNKFKIIQTISFEDHVHYTKQVLDDIVKDAKQKKAKIITTMKDFVKLPIDYHSKISYLNIKYDISNIDQLLQI